MRRHPVFDPGLVGVAAAGPSERERWVIETMARQLDVTQALLTDTESASSAGARCLPWLGVQRQAETYLRHLGPWTERVRSPRLAPEVLEHKSALETHKGRARLELGAFDEETRREARAELGIRVAFIGKGGAGKTMIAATLARQLARQGRKVLAVDLDTNPGLSMSLGLGGSESGLGPEALEEHPGASYGWQLAEGLTPLDAVDRYAEVGPDGVRFLAVGKISSLDKSAARRSIAAMREILLGLGAPDIDVIADMEAGPTTPFEGYHAFAETVVVVVGPAWRSAMTARRLLPMVDDRNTIVAANRFRDEPDHPDLTSPSVRVPFDPCVAEAERHGRAPLDACPRSPATSAVETLRELLLTQEVRP